MKSFRLAGKVDRPVIKSKTNNLDTLATIGLSATVSAWLMHLSIPVFVIVATSAILSTESSGLVCHL